MNGNSSYSVIRAIRGPITLITLGVLFALQNFTRFGFDQTWPVLLIVFGLLSLMQRGAAPPAPPPPPRNYPPAGFAQSPAGFPETGSSQNPRGYAQSPYSQTSPGASAKGGFGTTAPPRAGSAESAPTSSGGGPV
jgi:hypothetical protein